MNFRMILGRAGSGKTWRCLEDISSEMRRNPEGPGLIFLVPEQATFQMERALLERNHWKAFSRARVLSFRRLALWAFTAAGGPVEPPIAVIQRKLLLRLILRRRELGLKIFGRAARQMGFEDECARIISEFLRQRVTPERLRAAAAAIAEESAAEGSAGKTQGFINGANGRDAARFVRDAAMQARDAAPRAAPDHASHEWLIAKIHDLAMLFEDYNLAIAGKYSNPEETPEHLAVALEHSPVLAGAQIWIDGFSSFTAQEFRALGAIFQQAGAVALCLCAPPEWALREGMIDGAARTFAAWEPDAPRTARPRPEGEEDSDLFAETQRTCRRVCDLARSRGAEWIELTALPQCSSAINAAAHESAEPSDSNIAAVDLQHDVNANASLPFTRWSAAPELEFLERELFAFHPRSWGAPAASMQFVETLSPRAQAQAAVRELLRLRRDRGIRWREMAVIARNIERHLDDLIPALREHGVPFFADRRRPLQSHPLCALLKSAVRIAAGGWQTKDVLDYLKCGLAIPKGIDPRAADRLENYAIEHGVNGRSAWIGDEDWGAWIMRRIDEPGSELGSIEQARKQEVLRQLNTWRREILGPLLAWEQEYFIGQSIEMADGNSAAPGQDSSAGASNSVITGEHFAEALAGLLRKLDAAAGIERLRERAAARGDADSAEEHRQALATVINALAEISDALGEAALQSDETPQILESALGDLRIGMIPAGIDAVSLASIDRSRQPELKAVLVIGLAEGEFPRQRPQDAILLDLERKALRAAGLELAEPASEQSIQESYFAYIALTRSRQLIRAYRPIADARGAALRPSPYWKRLRALFPHAPIETPNSESALWEGVETPAQWAAAWASSAMDNIVNSMRGDAHSSIMKRAALRLGGGTEAFSPLPGDAFYLAERADAACGAPHRLAWNMRLVLRPEAPSSGARLAAGLAHDALVRGDSVSSSLSRFETFAGCPFRHFAAYLLDLKERARRKLDMADLGSLYHAVLKLWVEESLRKNQDISLLQPSEIRDSIGRILADTAPRLKNELMLSSARLRSVIQRARELLCETAGSISISLRDSAFRPLGVEVSFGSSRPSSEFFGDNSRPAVSLANSPSPSTICGASLPPLILPLGNGLKLLLRGRVDRVDAAFVTDQSSGGSHDIGIRVIDYKSSPKELNLAKVYHGLELQLPAYLPALIKGHGLKTFLAGDLKAAGAFYLGIQGERPKGLHPDDLADDADGKFQRRKMRGFFHLRWLSAMERASAGEKGVYHAFSYLKDGSLDKRGGDWLADEDMNTLLGYVERLLVRLANEMIHGVIHAAPAKFGGAIHCEYCPYMTVCRYDDGVDSPRRLESFHGKEGALEAMRDLLAAESNSGRFMAASREYS